MVSPFFGYVLSMQFATLSMIRAIVYCLIKSGKIVQRKAAIICSFILIIYWFTIWNTSWSISSMMQSDLQIAVYCRICPFIFQPESEPIMSPDWKDLVFCSLIFTKNSIAGSILILLKFPVKCCYSDELSLFYIWFWIPSYGLSALSSTYVIKTPQSSYNSPWYLLTTPRHTKYVNLHGSPALNTTCPRLNYLIFIFSKQSLIYFFVKLAKLSSKIGIFFKYSETASICLTCKWSRYKISLISNICFSLALSSLICKSKFFLIPFYMFFWFNCSWSRHIDSKCSTSS